MNIFFISKPPYALTCKVFYGALPDGSQKNVVGVLALQMGAGRKDIEMRKIISPEGEIGP